MTRSLAARFIHQAIGRPVLAWRRRELERFRRLLESAREAQAARLTAHLALVRGSQFARDFGLDSVKTASDLRQALPIADYGRVAPYVERVRHGDVLALFDPASAPARVLMFALTSGTTTASKAIPVTASSLAEYRRSWTIWGTSIAEAHPRIPFGGVLSLASGWRAKRSPCGLPEGSISGFLAHSMHGTLRLTNAFTPEVAEIQDAEQRWYTALRLALARDDLRMITTANPSTLVALARHLERHQDRLIADVANGALSWVGKSPATGLDCAHGAVKRRAPGRAKVLADAAAREGGLTPRAAWPELELLGVWTGGTLAPYLAMLPACYGDLPRRDHGLSASEGRMTIPLADGDDAGVLNVDGPFFEFIPEALAGGNDAPTLLAHELAVGERYVLVVTTSGGLVRYNLGDVVECRGHVGSTPRLAFLHKGSQVANLTGEKLSAHQAVEAARDVLRASAWGVPAEFVIAPYFADPPCYFFFAEGEVHARLAVDAAAFGAHLDVALRQRNMEYDDKRRSGRLGAIRLARAPDGTFARLRDARMDKAGATLEQYKHPFLIAETAFAAGLIDAAPSGRNE